MKAFFDFASKFPVAQMHAGAAVAAVPASILAVNDAAAGKTPYIPLVYATLTCLAPIISLVCSYLAHRYFKNRRDKDE